LGIKKGKKRKIRLPQQQQNGDHLLSPPPSAVNNEIILFLQHAALNWQNMAQINKPPKNQQVRERAETLHSRNMNRNKLEGFRLFW